MVSFSCSDAQGRGNVGDSADGDLNAGVKDKTTGDPTLNT